MSFRNETYNGFVQLMTNDNGFDFTLNTAGR